MNEERQDPELDSLRGEWDAPSARPGFDARVVAAYRSRFDRPWTARWGLLLTFALSGAALVVAVLVYQTRPEPRYRPVREPHFYIVSAGEHP